MKELGEYLKKAREARNISLKDIQESTKIRLTYLEAIEQGDFQRLPGEVYCKGFLASYATAVGLDQQDVLKRYHQSKSDPETAAPVAPQTGSSVGQSKPSVGQSKPPVSQSKATEPVSKMVQSKKGTRMPLIVLGVFAVLLAVVLGLLYGKDLGWLPVSVSRTRPKTIVPAKTKNQNHLLQKHPFLKKTFVEPSAQPTPTPAPKPSPSSPNETVTKQIFPAPISIYASFNEPVWIRLSKDSIVSEDGRTFLPSDPQQLWTAQHEIDITVGNAAGIKLKINGKDVAPLGEHNQVFKLKITPDGKITKTGVNQ